MLGDYTLVHNDTLTNEDVINIPVSLVKEGTTTEILDYIEKAVK